MKKQLKWETFRNDMTREIKENETNGE